MFSNNNQDQASAEPSKTKGKIHSVKGGVVETVGDVTGLGSLQRSGAHEHAQGETEYKAAQAEKYGEGIENTLVGNKNDAVGYVTGDTTQQAAGKAEKEKGETQRDINKPL